LESKRCAALLAPGLGRTALSILVCERPPVTDDLFFQVAAWRKRPRSQGSGFVFSGPATTGGHRYHGAGSVFSGQSAAGGRLRLARVRFAFSPTSTRRRSCTRALACYENAAGALRSQAVAGPPLRLRVAREHSGCVGALALLSVNLSSDSICFNLASSVSGAERTRRARPNLPSFP
jgi:hypothetical protein